MRYIFVLLLLFFVCFHYGRGQEIKPKEYMLSTEIEESDLLPVQKAWEYSFIGKYQEALRAYDLELDTRESAGEKQGPLNSKEFSFFQSFHPENAHDYIINRSQTEQITIINEAHHNPRHRVFVQHLLLGMYENGYRYLGIEALSPNFSDATVMGNDTLLNERAYPLNSQYTGYYTREPQFANMIRAALEIGFTVFAYERTPFQTVERDSAQAQNVMKILHKDPKAKILLYCGYAHLVESIRENRVENYGKSKWLAAIIKDLSGIDPFTINQEVLTERLVLPNSSYYAYIEAEESSVFLNDQRIPFNGPEGFDKFDLLVYHPPTQYLAGRPDWLYRDGSYKKYKVKRKAFKGISCPCLVKAYKKEEALNSVPLDIIALDEDTNDQPYLVLPPGAYILEVVNAKKEKRYLNARVR